MIQSSTQQGLIFTPVDLPNLNKSLNSLSNTGDIKFTGTGFVYVDIDDDYIHHTFSLIKVDSLLKPKYFDEETNSIGAHISLIYPEEKIAEPYNSFTSIEDFKVVGLFHTELENKRYYALKIISPTIEKFRLEMGLSKQPTIKGYSVFPHITVGVMPLT